MTEERVPPGGTGFGGFVSRLLARIGIGAPRKARSRLDSTAFTSAFVSLAAKMAMADGVAVKAEADAFERFLEVSPAEAHNVRRLYRLASEDASGFEVYADRIGALLKEDPAVKRDVFDCLLYVACSDGILHPAEDQFLQRVATRFGMTDDEFRAAKAMFVHDPGNPYEVLGLAPDAPNQEIRARYRKLVAETHPDRFSGQGAPAAVIKAATAKLAAINAAYEAIEAKRGGRSGA